MTLKSSLETALRDSVFRKVTEIGSKVTLHEKTAKMKVDVVGLTPAFATIKADGKGNLNHLAALRDGPRRKICDYLLVARVESEDHVVFVELKKSPRSSGKPEEQLLRSIPLLDYLLSVCSVEESIKNYRPNLSYVIIYEKFELHKPLLRPDPSGMIRETKYKSINIKVFRGTEVNLADMIRT